MGEKKDDWYDEWRRSHPGERFFTGERYSTEREAGAVSDCDPVVEWLHEPEKHDYDNAATYLELLNLIDRDGFIKAAKAENNAFYYAKDILRASREPLLYADDEHVQHDLQKIHDGKKLSPILLVRGDAKGNRPLIIADGYHRVCAAYWVSENSIVQCRIV